MLVKHNSGVFSINSNTKIHLISISVDVYIGINVI